MPTSTSSSSTMAATSTISDSASDPLAGVDHIIVIDNGAQNIRIASIPYPFAPEAISAAISPSDSSTIDPSILSQTIAVDVLPNAIARTRSPHIIPSLPSSETSPTAPPAGSKTSVFVSSHIHSLLDDYAALHLRLPHQSGIVVDWAAQKTIWDHVLTNHLAKLPQQKANAKKGKLLEGKAVIITEAYFNLEHSQHATDLLLFEHYGANAVWRTFPATLAGLGTDAFRSDLTSLSPAAPIQAELQVDQDAPVEEQPGSSATPPPSAAKRPLRTPRASTSTTVTTSESSTTIPRILTIPRPQAMLVLDLGYSFCHSIPIIDGVPHYPSIRRLEVGGKMLINLLKETLSFQQLDMMDESWLMSHIFAKTSFVAASVGRRVYGSDKVERELEAVQRKEAAEWSYCDLLLLAKYGRGKRKGKGKKEIGVTWSLPDYGGEASGNGGKEKRDRARYGYFLEGPKPQPFEASQRSTDRDESSQQQQQQRKRPKTDSLLHWESSLIAASSPPIAPHQPSPSTDGNNDDDDDDEEEEDIQTLSLTTERFSMVEHLFNPTALGLDQKPLPELILDSVRSVSSQSPVAADMMWSNILLTGGLSNTVNMRRRLENELRPLAPADVPVGIWPKTAGDGSLTAVKGGVGLACELAARETVRRWQGDERASKKKPRKSRAADSAPDVAAVDGKRVGWLTYAQWMNPVGGSEADGIVRSANQVFYGSGKGAADAA